MSLKERIKNTHLKQKYIAEYIGVSPAMVSKIANESSVASKYKMDLLEELLTKYESLGL